MLRRTLVSTLMVVLSTQAFGQAKAIKGSDTLMGVMTDAILAAGMENEVTYVGGGSGKGQTGLVEGEQTIAPSSSSFDMNKHGAKLQEKGIVVKEHVIGLDGVGVWANKDLGLTNFALTLDQLKKIFTCEATRWGDLRAGAIGTIEAYRRDDNSGTTDTFKKLVGIEKFGDCVIIIAETTEIAHITSTRKLAIAYAGMSAKRDGNATASIAKNAQSPAFQPTVDNVRSFDYPLARKLYVYEATGSASVSGIEADLLNNLLDRSFVDPILQAHDFFTLD